MGNGHTLENSDVFFKTGRELLPQNIVEEFQDIRGTNYQRILHRRLSEYTMAEWVTCLKEKVLLEYCLPFVLEKLEMDPLTPGFYRKGELLYDVTMIDKTFWDAHPEWYESFRTIVERTPDLSKTEMDNAAIRDIYIESYKRFLSGV